MDFAESPEHRALRAAVGDIAAKFGPRYYPAGLAAKITELSATLGLNARVAHITGDDLAQVIGDLQPAGHDFANLDTGLPLAKADLPVVTANAYLGG